MKDRLTSLQAAKLAEIRPSHALMLLQVRRRDSASSGRLATNPGARRRSRQRQREAVAQRVNPAGQVAERRMPLSLQRNAGRPARRRVSHIRFKPTG